MHYPTSVLMIRPVSFGFNPQTAQSNAFQQNDADQQEVQGKAVQEFDNFVSILRSYGVNVLVMEDTAHPYTPDAIFPNNWISFHATGDVVLYPMQAENRRLERREDIVNHLKRTFNVRHVIDLSPYELEGKYLEGTGSMVLNSEDKLAYTCLSPRIAIDVLHTFCDRMGYKPIVFRAFDQNRQAIYHTNVMMCIADRYIVICLESITDAVEREAVITSIHQTGKNIFDISFKQMNQFAGNMLEVLNADGESLLIMSASAYSSLADRQISMLQQFSRIVAVPIPTIERNGGGSVRCMMAEIRLPVLV